MAFSWGFKGLQVKGWSDSLAGMGNVYFKRRFTTLKAKES